MSLQSMLPDEFACSISSLPNLVYQIHNGASVISRWSSLPVSSFAYYIEQPHNVRL